MNHWRGIREDLELTARRPAGDGAMHRAFVEKNKITKWAFVPRRADDLPYILHSGRFPAGFRRYPPGGFDLGPPPGLDHARLYRGKGRACLIYHTYQPPGELAPEVAAWAKAAGLEARVCGCGASWYFPGHTCLVLVCARGDHWSVPEEDVD